MTSTTTVDRVRHSVTVAPDLLEHSEIRVGQVSTIETSIILPAFNEEAGVGVVIDRLRELLGPRHELIVVDDGSADGTALVAELRGCRVIRHAENVGKGAALRTGIAAARGAKIIVLDADDTYPVAAVMEIEKALDEFDMVSGARTDGRFHISPFNRFGNAAFRFLLNRLCGVPQRDPLTGLYGLRRSVLLAMDLQATGFGIEAEIVIKGARMSLRSMDLPIAYRDRIGDSKLSPIRDGFVISGTILALALGRMGVASTADRTPIGR